MQQTVTLDSTSWQQIINVLANCSGFSWTVTNDLLMKLGEQLRHQQEPQLAQTPPWNPRPNGPDETAVLDEGLSPDRRVPRR